MSHIPITGFLGFYLVSFQVWSGILVFQATPIVYHIMNYLQDPFERTMLNLPLVKPRHSIRRMPQRLILTFSNAHKPRKQL